MCVCVLLLILSNIVPQSSFYAIVKIKDGFNLFKEQPKLRLTPARCAIHCHMPEVGQEMKIFHDPLFTRANKVLDGVLKQCKRDGGERQVPRKTYYQCGLYED